MARIIVPPAAPLSRFVRHFLVETDLSGMSLLPAINFPTIVLMVSGASRPQGLDTVSPAFVSGAQPLPLWLELQPGTSFISAMLKPGCLEVFFDLPVERLTGTNIPLEELIGPSRQSTLLAQTLAARGVAAQIEPLQTLLLKLASQREIGLRLKGPLLPVTSLFEPVSTLSRATGLGERQFERRFAASFGLTLRTMRRITRNTAAMAMLLSRPVERGWQTRIAQDCGYFDQAHFTREFGALAGYSPSEFVRHSRLAPSPEFRLTQYGPQDMATLFELEGEEWSVPGMSGPYK